MAGKLCTTHLICGNLGLSQRLTDPISTDVLSRQFRAAYWLITTKLIPMSWSEILPSLVILSLFTFELHVIEIFLQNSFWCYISVCGHPGVTSVQGGILADYDQIDTHVLKWNPAKCGYPESPHIRATRDLTIPSKLRFDAIYLSVAILASRQFRAAYWLITTKTQVVDENILTQSSASSKTGKLCTTHFICGNLVLSQLLTDPILADVVSRQFRTAYWLITTKLIHMSWSDILPCLVILSSFPFELHVIEIFLPNSVLMLYICGWPSWCHVSSGRHIGWLRPKL